MHADLKLNLDFYVKNITNIWLVRFLLWKLPYLKVVCYLRSCLFTCFAFFTFLILKGKCPQQ